MGCFSPERDAERYWPTSLSPGKTRTIWYILCAKCYELPDVADRVEDVLEAHAAQARN
jgi:hypothetical protein